MIQIRPIHWGSAILALVIIIASLFFTASKAFFLIIGIGIIIGIVPFVFSVIIESKNSAKKEQMFLEFSRNLVESVRSGTPISKSIVNVRKKPYGVLSPHVNKLANQISMGIPLTTALEIFSKDVNNKTISRALTLIGQAEKAGGDIGGILEAVTEAVTTSDKLRKERKAAISTLVSQGYIIFLVFIIIVLVMQFKIIPLVSGIADVGSATIGPGGIGNVVTGAEIDADAISKSFLYLLLIQGFFSGLTIGKLSEGSIKAGIKHSFTLMLMSFLASAGANLFL
jgi:archaeal flagellar protein FlaJ